MIGAACGAAFALAFAWASTIAIAPGTGSAAAFAAPSPPARTGAFEARALAVIDGDTIEARVAAFPGHEIVTRVRLAGVDAPELRGRCPAEAIAGEAAAEALGALVEGRRLTLTGVKGDKFFGRVVARVATREAGDVSAALIAAGHGRAYGGGRRGSWC